MSRWLECLVPPSLPEEARPKARAFVGIVTFAAGMTAFSAVLAAASGLSVLCGLTACAALASVSVLIRFRGGRDPAATVRAFLWFFIPFLCFAALATTPVDPTMLGYLFVMPLVAATMLERKHIKVWVIRALVGVTVTLIAGHLGLRAAEVDPFPLANAILNFAGTFVGATALLNTLAVESERSMERLKEAERAKSAFLANIGHEIRTPMNGVLGMTDALLGAELGPREREMATTIRSSGQLMMALIDDLLDLSKLEARRLVLSAHPFSLTQFAAALRLSWTPLAERKRLKLTVVLDASLPAAITLDELRFKQIVGNLLNNALKFTEQGAVSLLLSTQGAFLCCVVEDTGIGITPAQQERLFSRFAQADEQISRRYQGTGLGLALSRELALHMGGTLEVESVFGQGSRFICRLPLVAAVLPETIAAPVQSLSAGVRVLVVDDNAVNRLVAQRLLERSACVVEVAVDGKGALEALSRAQFDVVLMDVHMPELDGLEVTRRIRAGGDDRLPIIGVSASAATEDIEGCRQAGMNDFLSKPMTHERLVATLLRNLAPRLGQVISLRAAGAN
ncbi:MAG: response regulator [Archangium sp.]|nr:response regulator [Archangium sp.]MDP3157942.1 response regulator [Archangium sp.]MDP3572108.1 response regulator [Archangium sp.]